MFKGKIRAGKYEQQSSQFLKPAKRRGLEKARKNELKSDGTHGTTQKKTEELQGDVERREAAMAPCLIPLQQRGKWFCLPRRSALASNRRAAAAAVDYSWALLRSNISLGTLCENYGERPTMSSQSSLILMLLMYRNSNLALILYLTEINLGSESEGTQHSRICDIYLNVVVDLKLRRKGTALGFPYIRKCRISYRKYEQDFYAAMLCWQPSFFVESSSVELHQALLLPLYLPPPPLSLILRCCCLVCVQDCHFKKGQEPFSTSLFFQEVWLSALLRCVAGSGVWPPSIKVKLFLSLSFAQRYSALMALPPCIIRFIIIDRVLLSRFFFLFAFS